MVASFPGLRQPGNEARMMVMKLWSGSVAVRDL